MSIGKKQSIYFEIISFHLIVIHNNWLYHIFMKKFKPIKVKNGQIRLPDEFLDQLLINDGDFLLIVEEDGRFYIRKTRESPDETEPESETPKEAPKTFDEIMRDAQEQIGSGMLPEDIMKSMQDTLQNPEMMKKIQDMAMNLFKGFSVPPNSESSEPVKKPKKDTNKSKDEDDDDDDEGFKINIE